MSSRTYLASIEGLKSIERDPYWPKWDSPWWHMSLLNEMDLAKEIPATSISKMVRVLKNHYPPVFPIKEEEVPTGTDPYRKIACLCAVGNMCSFDPPALHSSEQAFRCILTIK